MSGATNGPSRMASARRPSTTCEWPRTDCASLCSCLGGRNASKLERKVKRLQDALGEIRDLQVQLGWLEKQKNLADAEGIRMLLAELRATLLDREHDLRTALEEWTGNSAPKLEKRLKKVSGKGRFGGKRMQRELKDW